MSAPETKKRPSIKEQMMMKMKQDREANLKGGLESNSLLAPQAPIPSTSSRGVVSIIASSDSHANLEI
jgi:hypothetical protein